MNEIIKAKIGLILFPIGLILCYISYVYLNSGYFEFIGFTVFVAGVIYIITSISCLFYILDSKNN